MADIWERPPCPFGHVRCATYETCVPYGQATCVHRAWSSRFPFRVFQEGPSLTPQ